ncbi:uncharacterized protein YfkD [Paraliobacillus ryukyuensis]|uniref:YfkD-like protein n=1 Tax=Paraliobacillus ryukyuensis TaxID=200904 RepID=A0A366DZ31_9BACI|nr:YfkD family protein [Paraliobacillus ryukyuensis]RBO95360.1 YfkD-like protein [Paraliobacillus ryukyuensis]
MRFLKKLIIVSMIGSLGVTIPVAAADKKPTDIPNHVLSISEENTSPNSTKDEITLEPSEFVKELLEDSKVAIDNPDLIQQLNETTIKPSPLAIGYRGSIYLGHWPLHYRSDQSKVNWEYQKINTNTLNNGGSDVKKTVTYNQLSEAHIKGALMTKVDQPDQIKKMMLLTAKQSTKLPLSFHTVVGKDTKKSHAYAVPTKKQGELQAYAPAVNEKGIITYGEVYIQLKGSNKELIVKNVTKQEVAAWIPIQDYVSFSFSIK